MKKIIKKILIVIAIIISVILLDTLQSKLFNNSPIIRMRQYYIGDGPIYYIDEGILTRHYVYENGNHKTVYRWTTILY